MQNDTQICKNCANRTLDRCARYHQSLCSKVYKFCQGDLFLDKKDGISLYAMKYWIESLSPDEMKLPLLFEVNNDKILPLCVLKSYSSKENEHWCFYGEFRRSLDEDDES